MEFMNGLRGELKEKKEKEENERDKPLNLKEQINRFEELTNKKFIEFHDKYLPKLVYYCLRYFKNDEDKATDNAQDSLLIALSKIESYDPDKAAFSTWLFTIARNEALQKIKKDSRIPTVSMDVKVDEEGTTIKEFLEDSSQEDNFVREEDILNKKKSIILKKCISKLKPNFKQVIEMRDINNMTYKDIAISLGEDRTFEIESNGEYVKLPLDANKIYSLKDWEGNEVSYETDIKTDSPFYTHIRFIGKCKLEARFPFNLSTIKSRIRGGRLKLQEMVREDFKKLNDMYY